MDFLRGLIRFVIITGILLGAALYGGLGWFVGAVAVVAVVYSADSLLR